MLPTDTLLHIGDIRVTYDLMSAIIAALVLLCTLAVRYFFRRGKPLGGERSSANASLATPTPPDRLKPPANAPRARLLTPMWGLCLLLTLSALSAWGFYHVFTTNKYLAGDYTGQFKWSYVAVFAFLAIQLLLAYCERPKYGYVNGNRYYVVTLVPLYNEDPRIVQAAMSSLFYASRRPNAISVVDDGSTKADYTQLREWFLQQAEQLGIAAAWERTNNRGKRHAQVTAVEKFKPQLEAYGEHAIILTMDSDGILDPEAIHQGLMPFSDDKIQAVGGVVLASNNRVNLLARFTDLMFVTQQLTDRSAMSTVGSGLVLSGGLAFYRAWVLLDNIEAYLGETFAGNPVTFSDDSKLTLYALDRGKVVQQPSAMVLTAMPQKLSHHVRQQMRWMRGSFIRGLWRLHYLPLFSWGFMRQSLGWAQLIVSTYIFSVLLVANPIAGRPIPWEIAVVPVAVSYLQSLRYWSFKRSDMPFWSHLLNFLLAPVAALWSFLVMRPMRFYAWCTCFKTGKWGTRENVEALTNAAPLQIESTRVDTLPPSLNPNTLYGNGEHTQQVNAPRHKK
ncbi:MAG TPA: glycosyltransferase [Candidatus Saccharimonadales bacterium]|nr:glycosyltransferase [Candidatus Saccharimonadales bacterium]